MNGMHKPARHGAALLGMVALHSLGALPGPAWAQDKKSPEVVKKEAVATFDAARRNMADAQGRQERAMLAKASACQEATAAENALLAAKSDDAKLGELAQSAIRTEAACERAERLLDEATKVTQATRSLWRNIAADLGDCGKPDTECTAQKQAKLVGLLASVREPAKPDLQDGAKRLQKIDHDLIEKAAGMQKRTAEQRANAAAAYGVQDPLLASVLAAQTADDKTLRGREIREGSADVIKSVPELRWAARDAQVATNQLVSNAATLLKPCEKETTPAEQQACIVQQEVARQAGAHALARAEGGLAAAQQAQERLKEGAAMADAGLKWSKAKDRAAAVRFGRLLDKYDDARSMLGDSSGVRLTADGTGGQATLKLAVGRALPSGFRDTTVILSAPTDDKGFTPFSSVDGLSRAASIEIGMKNLHASSLTEDILRQAGASIKVGVQPHSYLSSIDPSAEVSQNHKLWALSVFSAFYRLRAENPSVHILKLQMQRTLSDETSETRCPVPAAGATATMVTCVTGAFKPLEPDWRTLLSYQMRLQGEQFGFAPLVTYSARKDRRWEVELPVYFIPGSGKDAPLSAGLKLNWTNKPGEGKQKTRFGLFVGSTFDFWGAPE